MRNTNRAVNRIVLFLLGIVLIAAGALVVLALTVPLIADEWTRIGGAVQTWGVDLKNATLIGDSDVSWFAVIALAVILVLVVLLIAIASATVRGRSRAPLRSTGADDSLGRITVTEGFASEALKKSLAERDEILSARVSANEVRRQSVLHVSVTPRQNTSPRQITEYVDTLVTNLATLTGQEVPTYISVHSGIRAKLAHDQRRLT